MIRTSDFRTQDQKLESLSTGQLFSLFEFFLKTKTTAISHADLVEAWGLLFSALYLSAEELVNGMQGGEHLLGEDKENLLREFIRDDCTSGGTFVVDVIRKGGKIDRAALHMIAGLETLSGVDCGGTTPLHMLAETCDKTVRPAFILRAGKKALSGIYDARGFPVLFTILALSDLRRDDLKAIEQVFSRDDLRNLKHKNRTGRSALEIFTETSQRLKGHVPRERNEFAVTHAVKNTNFRSELKSQLRSRSDRHHPTTDIMGNRSNNEGDAQKPDDLTPYGDFVSRQLDDLGKQARGK
ncbi:MAG: hypothetical protein PHT99_05870, partial [Methanoregula sp.]|nr:hypothetical protein [Methanoregula sp.]